MGVFLVSQLTLRRRRQRLEDAFTSPNVDNNVRYHWFTRPHRLDLRHPVQAIDPTCSTEWKRCLGQQLKMRIKIGHCTMLSKDIKSCCNPQMRLTFLRLQRLPALSRTYQAASSSHRQNEIRQTCCRGCGRRQSQPLWIRCWCTERRRRFGTCKFIDMLLSFVVLFTYWLLLPVLHRGRSKRSLSSLLFSPSWYLALLSLAMVTMPRLLATWNPSSRICTRRALPIV